MIGIEKPRIETAEVYPDGTYGRFVVEPLERGYGMTLGNSLRRVLLLPFPDTLLQLSKSMEFFMSFPQFPESKRM